MSEKTPLTLQNRIINFIIIFAILLISAFAVIQLNNQIKTITAYNLFRAKVSALFIKTTLEKQLAALSPEANIATSLSKLVISLKEGGIIEGGTIFRDTDTIMVATHEPAHLKKMISPEETERVRIAFKAAGTQKEIRSHIDKLTKTLCVYIPLVASGGETYLMRATFSLANIQEILRQVALPLAFTILTVIVATVIFGYMLSKTVIGPIMQLNEATKDIASGDLSMRVRLQTRDELEELADTFNDMTIALNQMRARAENANPLTKLPGNNVIREQVEKRIRTSSRFVVVHTDLDNFKAFNDKYGINKGDQAITITSKVLKEALKKNGSAGDFLGHEGGDDFVYITTPGKAYVVAHHITSEFDKRIRALYNAEDLKRGSIIATGRDGETKEFPVMTISLSGVSNLHREIESYAEVTNIAADVKKKVKAIEKSVFLLDKRGAEESPENPPKM
jgi:diguanylate cyclase (GGDEF)-like protein